MISSVQSEQPVQNVSLMFEILNIRYSRHVSFTGQVSVARHSWMCRVRMSAGTSVVLHRFP
jgi:hypothetical protein